MPDILELGNDPLRIEDRDVPPMRWRSAQSRNQNCVDHAGAWTVCGALRVR